MTTGHARPSPKASTQRENRAMTVHPEPTGLADPAGLDTERVHRIYRHPHANPELSMR